MFTWCENKSFSFFFQFGGKVNGRLIIDVAMVDPFYGLWVFAVSYTHLDREYFQCDQRGGFGGARDDRCN